ncbi:hypothetical protein GMAR_ORF81 [Golden Marseillevirus]|uniref:hypothetical protein n=1 Tax=Golden Marseillevirus TaxID=1720526 RepID=UPI000877A9CE|nr:hypothetical protein GMAR_ORF81 [Golden Marseillevirus]ALX27456.1 hypothetical protein GMAR_ORF81 [Golden Marseillevirus]
MFLGILQVFSYVSHSFASHNQVAFFKIFQNILNMKSFLDKRELVSFCLAFDEKVDPSEFTTKTRSRIETPKDVFAPWCGSESNLLPNGKRHGAYFERWSEGFYQSGTIESQFHLGLLHGKLSLSFCDTIQKTRISAEFRKGIPVLKVDIRCTRYGDGKEVWSCSWVYRNRGFPDSVEGDEMGCTRVFKDIKWSGNVHRIWESKNH